MGGIYIFFGSAYANALDIAYSSLFTVLFGIVTTSGIIEAIIGAIVALAIYKAVKPKVITLKS